MNLDIEQLRRELGEEGLRKLRDQLLTALPPEASHPAVRSLNRAEVTAARSRASFDLNNQPPTDGPVYDAMEKAKERASVKEAREGGARRLGRFYAEAYRTATGAVRFRVRDRYMGAIAYFALDNPSVAVRLQGYTTVEEATARVFRLDEIMFRRGVPIGPRAADMLDSALVATVIADHDHDPELEPEAEAASAAPRKRRPPTTTKEPGRNVVRRMVPDDVWWRVARLIPSGPADKMTTKQRTTPDRTALAGIMMYLRSDSGWHSIPASVGCSPMLCRKRLKEWQDAGAWPKIEDALYEAFDDRHAVSWDKAKAAAGSAIVSAVEKIRWEIDWSVCEMSHAIFGHGTTYRRIVDGAKMLESTRQKMADYVAGYRRSETDCLSQRSRTNDDALLLKAA